MSHPILERHLERLGLRPVYLFFGDEEFLMHRALRRLEEELTALSGEAPVKTVQDAQEADLDEFLAEARVTTLWGAGQLRVLRRVDQYKAEQLKPLAKYLDHPPGRAWVVLMAENLKAREVERHAIWGRLLKNEAALAFPRLREDNLLRWLTQEARALDKSLTLAAAQRLVEIAGDNLGDLTHELEKLALFAGAEKTLTPGMVGQLASHSRTYSIFALTDALGESGVHKRLSALAHLLELGEAPQKILPMLARQVRLLLKVKEQAGSPGPDLAKTLGVAAFSVKKLVGQAARFSPQALKAHLTILHQIYGYIKTSVGSPRLWLEWAVLQMGPS